MDSLIAEIYLFYEDAKILVKKLQAEIKQLEAEKIESDKWFIGIKDENRELILENQRMREALKKSGEWFKKSEQLETAYDKAMDLNKKYNNIEVENQRLREHCKKLEIENDELRVLLKKWVDAQKALESHQ